MRRLLLLAVCLAAPMTAADVSGTWDAEVELDIGSGTATFQFKQTGDALTGTYTGQLGEQTVTGKVTGDQVEWSFEGTAQGNKLTVVYKGTLTKDGIISGKCEYGGAGSGTFKATRTKSKEAYRSRKLTSMVA